MAELSKREQAFLRIKWWREGRVLGPLMLALALSLPAFTPAAASDASTDATERAGERASLEEDESQTIHASDETATDVSDLKLDNELLTPSPDPQARRSLSPEDLAANPGEFDPSAAETDSGEIIPYDDIEKAHRTFDMIKSKAPDHTRGGSPERLEDHSSDSPGMSVEMSATNPYTWTDFAQSWAVNWYRTLAKDVPTVVLPCVPQPGYSSCTAGSESPPREIRATDESKFPNRAVARIAFDNYEGNRRYCTGFLIDTDLVITNGHCLLEQGQNSAGGLGWYPASSYRIAVGYDHGTKTAQHVCRSKTHVTMTGWSRVGAAPNPAEWDFGAIRLNCSTSVGHFGYWWSSSQQHLRNWGLVTGHPGGGQQYESEGYRTHEESQLLFYDNPQVGGMSGSPRWNTFRDSCGSCAHAIARTRESGGSSGVLINRTVFDWLYKWKHEGW